MQTLHYWLGKYSLLRGNGDINNNTKNKNKKIDLILAFQPQQDFWVMIYFWVSTNAFLSVYFCVVVVFSTIKKVNRY